MLASVTIRNFKSFRDETLHLSDLTLLIGPNASGKSNALEGLQILSWLASGRRLGDLHYAIQSGEIAVRGAASDLTWAPGEDPDIILGCSLARTRDGAPLEFEIGLRTEEAGLRITREKLRDPDEETKFPLYWVDEPATAFGAELQARYNNFARGGKKPIVPCIDQQAVFTQLVTPARFGKTHEKSQRVIPRAARRLQQMLGGILFLDPSPRRMRGYGFTNERVIKGDGSNVSAVLHHLTESAGLRDEVVGFVRSLPEQEITGIGYVPTPRGEVMVKLTETFGGTENETEAALLSDGTLRVLAVAAALLSVPTGSMVVIEEIDNGVHPSRAADLLQRIQAAARDRQLRVLVTTHNPALQDALPTAALPSAVACYRDPQEGDSRLVRLEDLPSYPELVARGPLGRLVTRGVLDRFLKARDSEEERRDRSLRWFDEQYGGDGP